MICNRVASTRATIYSLSGSLPTAIFSKYYFMYLIYFGQINISVCLSVCHMFKSYSKRKYHPYKNISIVSPKSCRPKFKQMLFMKNYNQWATHVALWSVSLNGCQYQKCKMFLTQCDAHSCSKSSEKGFRRIKASEK